jgi:hypothetical protein
MAELKAAARDYARRERELDRARQRLRKDRLKAMRKAHKAGIPAADIGAEFGISKQRVLQLLRGSDKAT